MTNAARLAADYLRRAHLREQAIETLVQIGDFPDAVRECQEAAELAVKALLKLKDISYPRAHDAARLLRDPTIEGPLLSGPEIAEIEDASKALRRDRELSFYGAEDVIPLEYYERKDADQALDMLRRVRALVARAFERNGTPVP